MKKIIAATIASSLVSITSFALPKPVLTCESLDVTHRPFYTIKLFLFDVTHANYFGAVIEKVTDLAGRKKETIRKEGPGKVGRNDFHIVLGGYEDGLFVDNGDSIYGNRLSNGLLKGEMNLGDDMNVELICK